MTERKLLACSGIVLAGGRSSRMGRDKAGLRLGGRTLLEIQADKLAGLGITDILLSGASCPSLPGTRTVADVYRNRGPLGGLHACLRAAKNPACLVITVDTPLIPAQALRALCRAHRVGITLLRREGRAEPLSGVFDRRLWADAAALLEEGRGAVRELEDRAACRYVEYRGPGELLLNCNAPEDLAAAARLMDPGASRKGG